MFTALHCHWSIHGLSLILWMFIFISFSFLIYTFHSHLPFPIGSNTNVFNVYHPLPVFGNNILLIYLNGSVLHALNYHYAFNVIHVSANGQLVHCSDCPMEMSPACSSNRNENPDSATPCLLNNFSRSWEWFLWFIMPGAELLSKWKCINLSKHCQTFYFYKKMLKRTLMF